MAPRDAAVVSEEGERAARSSLWLSDPAGRACTARREPARGAQDRLVRNRSPTARRRRWSCGLVNSRVALLLSRASWLRIGVHVGMRPEALAGLHADAYERYSKTRPYPEVSAFCFLSFP